MNKDYRSHDRNQEDGRQRIIPLLVIILIASVIVNIILFAYFSSNLKDILSQEVDKINSTMDQKIDAVIRDKLEDIIIENYKREYNLPDNYSGIGVIAAGEVRSILELNVNARLNPPRDNQTTSSQSSAFIINKEGYVFTNAHCVTFEDSKWQLEYDNWGRPVYGKVGTEIREYTTIEANFKGKTRRYQMEIVGYDTEKDFALIKFKNPPQDLQAVTFGNSNLLNLGEEVVAIGNAQGLGTSLTTGVVSNTPQPYNDVEIIQTDTVINPGNSGGPLFNIFGEVIGVVSFKIIESYANEGLGFALSSNAAMKFIEKVALEKEIEIDYDISK